ncbi:MAG: sigma-70 family RNA polymerase sigma factor [Opitutaceae bacterium]|nr:sigma-70 family RNA polymerase sigma factor [Opitutaceae bacterium]
MTEIERESRIVALLTEIQIPLRLYVRSLLPGDPAAGDVAQQANATLWLKRGDFTLGTNFKAWAFSVARYEVLNYRKRQARDARLVFSERLEEVLAEDLAGQADDTERRHEALKRCLANLRGKDRALLLHRYAGAGTLAEYAAQTGQSAGGLKVTLHRLRNALLACIRGQLQHTEEMT